MNFCDLSFSSPAENLACDEALLDKCEVGSTGEVLRVWESARYFVVVGYGNSAAAEVHLPFCRTHSIPVLRRCTGGGTVLQGPGVINYSLILHVEDHPALASISRTNEFILKRHQACLTSLLGKQVELRGQTDLAIGGLKFSGNAQRRRKRSLLFHGSLLLQLDVELLESVLPMPSKEPDYRLGRPHSAFLMNLGIPANALKTALAKTWEAIEPLEQIPVEEISELVRTKYGTEEWNLKF